MRHRAIHGMVLLAALLVFGQARAQTDPLPSWNDGPAKQAIVDFVRATTDKAGPKFVPPEARIATFDNDGTLWVEQPIYTQVMFAIDRVVALAPKHPEWKEQEPFKAILSRDRAAMAKFTIQDIEKIIAVTHSGMTVEAFAGIVKEWAAAAKHPRFKRPYTELVYQPMLEVMQYLRENGYRTYIVTGGGQEFVRVFAEPVYGVPPEQVIGSAGQTKYGYGKDGKLDARQAPQGPADRRQGGQAGGHQLHHRAAALCGVRQLDRRSADARVDAGGRRGPAHGARASRRRDARVRLRGDVEDRHLPGRADGRGQEARAGSSSA